jgi:hypothetical protein
MCWDKIEPAGGCGTDSHWKNTAQWLGVCHPGAPWLITHQVHLEMPGAPGDAVGSGGQWGGGSGAGAGGGGLTGLHAAA